MSVSWRLLNDVRSEVEMNSPVTHAECIERMRQMEEGFTARMREERAIFDGAVESVEKWVQRLEDGLNGLRNLIVVGIIEFTIALVVVLFTILGGRL